MAAAIGRTGSLIRTSKGPSSGLREKVISFLSTVTVAPITSTVGGVPSEVLLTEADGMKGTCAVNLHNAVTVSKAHLGCRVAVLSSERLTEICASLGFALGCT